mmetsp:Transcript_206/g.900  ORF Transcript_206/g.900 Transcript_206/m.900 type:complete len:232 (+) Transcript_206:143-838(+)
MSASASAHSSRAAASAAAPRMLACATPSMAPTCQPHVSNIVRSGSSVMPACQYGTRYLLSDAPGARRGSEAAATLVSAPCSGDRNMHRMMGASSCLFGRSRKMSVITAPGVAACATTRSPRSAARRVSSRAARPAASLVVSYCIRQPRVRRNLVLSTEPAACMQLVTITTRPLALASGSCSSLASSQWPRKFTCHTTLKPSSVMVLSYVLAVKPLMAALHTSASQRLCSAL